MNKHGEEIFNAQFIARQYVLGGRFFVDLLATVPFEHLQSSERKLPSISVTLLRSVGRAGHVEDVEGLAHWQNDSAAQSARRDQGGTLVDLTHADAEGVPSHILPLSDHSRSWVRVVPDRATGATLDPGHGLYKRAAAHDNLF